jgi:hypothetical protein
LAITLSFVVEGYSLARANPIFLLHTPLKVGVLDGAIKIN